MVDIFTGLDRVLRCTVQLLLQSLPLYLLILVGVIVFDCHMTVGGGHMMCGPGNQ